ncbi:MAG: hypothetical protein CL734_04475 [Chloroflexi bacterium]|nr:hypothetical protein [Chloroflexota bacterium]
MIEETDFFSKDMERENDQFVEEKILQGANFPDLHEVSHLKTRSDMESGVGKYVAPLLLDEAVEKNIPTSNGNVPVRMFLPKGQIEGVYLHFHGGGWVIGTSHMQDQKLKDISDECNAVVMSVEYRLAPEHRYPAAQDDCEEVALWVIKHCKNEFGTEKIVVGGESAGAHLSTSTLIRLRDKHQFTGFKGANLVYGVYDLSMTPSSKLWGNEKGLLNTPGMEWFIDHYLQDLDRTDPDISPLYSDLSDMPNALFTVGTRDLLLDDTLFMHSRWEFSGNDATLNVYAGATHGFDSLPTQLAINVQKRIRSFISQCFSS